MGLGQSAHRHQHQASQRNQGMQPGQKAPQQKGCHQGAPHFKHLVIGAFQAIFIAGKAAKTGLRIIQEGGVFKQAKVHAHQLVIDKVK